MIKNMYMYFLTWLGCIIAFLYSMTILMIFYHYWHLKSYLFKPYISFILLILEYIPFDIIYQELSNYYGTHKIIGIIILLFLIFKSNINYLMHNYNCYYKNKLNPKRSKLLGHVEFIKSLVINYAICLEVLPLLKLTYWFNSSRDNVLMALCQSIMTSVYALILSYIIYGVCKFIVTFYKSPVRNAVNIKKYEESFKNNIFYFIHEYVVYRCPITNSNVLNEIKSLSLIFFLISLLLASSFCLPMNSLSYFLSSNEYKVHVQSQYPINGKRSINTHINFNKNPNYQLSVKGSSLLFNLKNKKCRKSFGYVNRVRFDLYNFSNKEYRFRCMAPVNGHNPINIILIVYPHKSIINKLYNTLLVLLHRVPLYPPTPIHAPFSRHITHCYLDFLSNSTHIDKFIQTN